VSSSAATTQGDHHTSVARRPTQPTRTAAYPRPPNLRADQDESLPPGMRGHAGSHRKRNRAPRRPRSSRLARPGRASRALQSPRGAESRRRRRHRPFGPAEAAGANLGRCFLSPRHSSFRPGINRRAASTCRPQGRALLELARRGRLVLQSPIAEVTVESGAGLWWRQLYGPEIRQMRVRWNR
jgi:hypothetical protein